MAVQNRNPATDAQTTTDQADAFTASPSRVIAHIDGMAERFDHSTGSVSVKVDDSHIIDANELRETFNWGVAQVIHGTTYLEPLGDF